MSCILCSELEITIIINHLIIIVDVYRSILLVYSFNLLTDYARQDK